MAQTEIKELGCRDSNKIISIEIWCSENSLKDMTLKSRQALSVVIDSKTKIQVPLKLNW